MSSLKTIFIIGGTGAQGIPVVRELVASGLYHLRILTRDPSGDRAKELLALAPDRIELQKGTFESEPDLRTGFDGAWGAFVNIDGFMVGEKTETFWTIRTYELAVEYGVKSYVFGNLDYGYKKSGYKPEFHAGHYDGKGRLGEWILDQNKRNKTGLSGYDTRVSLFTTGPYLDSEYSSSTANPPLLSFVHVKTSPRRGDTVC